MPRGYPSPLAPARGFDRHVRQVVEKLLAGGCPDVQLVAHAIRTSPRTLQRRLHRAGLTFVGVVQQARFAAARQMLGDRGRKVGDIARALGYSDPAHFTRAFTRWTGIAPRDFRRGRNGPPPLPRRRDKRGPR